VALAVRLFAPAAVHPDVRLVTEPRARAWNARGLAVNVWTVDDPVVAARLSALGAAAVITNEPARIRAAVRAATGR
jgi:glycerophosphoryl diester phosphodiesterase